MLAGTTGPAGYAVRMSSLLNLSAASEEHLRELPMPPYAFGGIAMLAFLVLLGVLWSFRGVAQKIATTDNTAHATHGDTDHQGSHH
jgi:hypothetical protein